jgi:hypothetical protein
VFHTNAFGSLCFLYLKRAHLIGEMGPKQSVNFESAADYAYILNERDTKNEDLPTSYVSAGSMINHWACRLA